MRVPYHLNQKFIRMKNKFFCAIIISLALFSFARGNGSSNVMPQSTISVSGSGIVTVQPDMVKMDINFSHVAQTTKEAKSEVDNKIQQIINVLRMENISDKDIQTLSINYDTETEYRDGRAVLVGQRVGQTISVRVNDIINNPNKFPLLLDKIATIDKANVRSIKFDVKNKSELFKQCRKLAYQNALDKANQYAAFSGQKVLKVLTLEENTFSGIIPRGHAAKNIKFFDGGSNIPTGEQEITLEISVTFLLD
jgi:uncharacterized protein YggE